MRRIFLAILIAAAAIPVTGQNKTVKVSCVGDSITYGLTLQDPAAQSYPAQLQRLLGSGYEVGRFGHSGACLLRRGHKPYMQTEEFRQALDFAGDIIVIHLGVNDTDPRNWPCYRDEFVPDYLALMDSLRSRSPQARFIIARITPLGQAHRRFLSGTLCWHKQIQDAIETVARISGAQLIDFYSPLIAHPDLMPDAIHPDAEGSGILARTVYSAITGDFGGLKMSRYYTDNMVLPRDRVFTIEGTADAGKSVCVSLRCKRYTTTAGSDGRWKVDAGPFPACGSTRLVIRSGGRKLEYDNVAIGEIWLCSGQSNMEFDLKQCSTSADAADASDAGLRLYNQLSRWYTFDVAWPEGVRDSLNCLDYFRPAEWTQCTPQAASWFSGVGYYFGRALRDSLDVPVGLICNAVGGSPQESWIDRNTLEDNYPLILRDWLRSDYIMPWVRERAWRNLDGVQGRHPYEPCYLFESGILPMEHFPISGVIWYQGESNGHNVEIYEELFPLFVDSWRRYFGEGLPVYYVQLSSLDRPTWPHFRDAQRRLETCRPGLGMAVSSDLGDRYDVHFKNKKPVGERLALLALRDRYGRDIVASGPKPLGFGLCNASGVVRVRFDREVAAPDGAPRYFEVLDHEDGLWHPVSARTDGAAVILDVSALRRPCAVRYAWLPFCADAALAGPEGLPVSTFLLQ